MPTKFEKFLRNMDFPFRSSKRTRAEDLREQLIEAMDELGLADHRGKPIIYGVTFDRVKNQHFDYWLFDELLVQIDAGEGGSGLWKPVHQVRAITWRKSSADLVLLLRSIVRHYPAMQFYRLMVFPLADYDGHRVSRSIYRR